MAPNKYKTVTILAFEMATVDEQRATSKARNAKHSTKSETETDEIESNQNKPFFV